MNRPMSWHNKPTRRESCFCVSWMTPLPLIITIQTESCCWDSKHTQGIALDPHQHVFKGRTSGEGGRRNNQLHVGHQHAGRTWTYQRRDACRVQTTAAPRLFGTSPFCIVVASVSSARLHSFFVCSLLLYHVFHILAPSLFLYGQGLAPSFLPACVSFGFTYSDASQALAARYRKPVDGQTDGTMPLKR